MVDLKLVDYIKRHLERGYSEDELKKILKENEWDGKEVNTAFKFLNSKKSKKEKPTQPLVTKPTKDDQLKILKNFIVNARSKGVKDNEIRSALLAKKWPENLVTQGFSDLRPPTQMPKPAMPKPKNPRPPFNWKLFIWYVVAFIIATAILSGTIFVYYYVVGLSDYTVTVDGEALHGKCLELNCSDMKQSALTYAQDNLGLMFIIGAIASLIIVSAYAFLPFRQVVLWVVNSLYFIALAYIGYVWIRFTGSL